KRLNGTIIRRKNEYIVDFGQNFAGVVELKLPKNLKKNDEIIIRHSETLDEDGDLFTDTLRKAYSTDKYIANGDECDLLIYTPISVYHGFRYAKISGNIDLFDESDVHGIVMYNDIDNASYFKCGSAIVNNIQQNIINTERSNIYGILTDCPQRDERMGWLNDSTVRFEEIAYNFNIGKMFKKVILDVKDTQDMDGSITCTAPFIYGERPADPVCASYMIMSKKLYEDSGDVETLKNTYESYKSWLMCLENNSTDFIMNYSHYGDWAGPSYACGDQISDIYTDEHSGYLKDEAACSALTDGKFMSTGYLYFQAKIMSEFAGILKNTDDEKLYKNLADNIKEAFNKKWVNKETLTVSTNSQGSIAFALWLEILPKDMEKPMAEKLNQDLIDSNLMITTGNLTTRYLFDVLTKFGFVDTAWKLITNEKYPSLGFMIQNEATTVWERFELKKNDGMNSHNHPMYGAVSYWFYRYIAGVSPTSKGYKTFDVMPYVPKDLTSMTANVDTPYGEINVRWNKRYGIFHLYINVPFGTEARVVIDDKIEKVQSGYWHFKKFINKAK
ncbi:MAG: family 78 glycoside hydrolase catalytic domain, partial [Oscillospiraceae bacterium]